MKHKISKIKIKSGKDANKMLMRLLVRNFVASGHIKTTKTKALYLKGILDSLADSALHYTQAAKNRMLAYFITEKAFLAFVDAVKVHSVGKTSGSGSVSVKKHIARVGDAATLFTLAWSQEAAVSESKSKEVKEVTVKADEATEEKPKKSKVSKVKKQA